MRTRRPPTLVMLLRSTASEEATRSLATAGLERTRKQGDVERGEGQVDKHHWWWSCGPQKLPFVAMIMEIRRRCPTYGKVWWKRENFWNLVNLKERERKRSEVGEKWRKKIMRHGSMTWQPFTTIGLNQWLILEPLHPVQYPSYCTGCESGSSAVECEQIVQV